MASRSRINTKKVLEELRSLTGAHAVAGGEIPLGPSGPGGLGFIVHLFFEGQLLDHGAVEVLARLRAESAAITRHLQSLKTSYQRYCYVFRIGRDQSSIRVYFANYDLDFNLMNEYSELDELANLLSSESGEG